MAEAMAPEQMRALAGQLESNADAHQEPAGTERRRAAAALRAAADELDRLRYLIKSQQHDDLCAVWHINGGTDDDGCTCWKAEARG